MPVTDIALLDNDVVLKTCTYRCQDEVANLTSRSDGPAAVLTVATYAIRTRLERSTTINDKAAALTAFDSMLQKISKIEATQAEVAIAGELEEEAAACGLELDVGESLLLAILLERNCSYLLTGDKRAIAAIAKLKPGETGQRIICFELLIAALLQHIPHGELRARVCAEPSTDKAITNCFGCSATGVEEADILAGLGSYYSSLARTAGAVLADLKALQR